MSYKVGITLPISNERKVIHKHFVKVWIQESKIALGCALVKKWIMSNCDFL